MGDFFWSHWFRTKTPPPGPPPLVRGNADLASSVPKKEVEETANKIAEENAINLARQNITLLGKLSHTEYCEGCGGLYDQGFLTTTLETTITVELSGRLVSGSVIAPPPRFITRSYCRKCKPESNIILILQTDDGNKQDTKRFDLTELYFKETDADGEPQFSVSLEDFQHIFCDVCGEHVSKLTKCAKCRAKKES